MALYHDAAAGITIASANASGSVSLAVGVTPAAIVTANATGATVSGTLGVTGNAGIGSLPSQIDPNYRLESVGVGGAILKSTDTTSARSSLSAWQSHTSGDNKFVIFYTEASPTERGSITYNRAGGLTAYNTTSDYRSKDITGKYEASGETIDQLQVYMGKMKGATIARPMMIAHEAAAVVPYAVTGEKDAEDKDGKPIYQSMDHQIFVPLLIAEVQALRSRVALLERN